MKRIFVVLLGLAFCFLCGCNGYKEIDRGYIVTSLGISQNKNNATIYIEAISSSNVNDSAPKRVVLTSVGDNIQAAFAKLNKTTVKPFYFEQLGTVVLNHNPSAETISFLKNTINVNLGICLVKTNDIISLFKYEPPSSFLGYDIIGLVKSIEKEQNSILPVRFYQLLRERDVICEILIENGTLILKQRGINFEKM